MFGDCPSLDGRSVQGTDLAMIWFYRNVTCSKFGNRAIGEATGVH
jgi:hypothetical protein